MPIPRGERWLVFRVHNNFLISRCVNINIVFRLFNPRFNNSTIPVTTATKFTGRYCLGAFAADKT